METPQDTGDEDEREPERAPEERPWDDVYSGGYSGSEPPPAEDALGLPPPPPGYRGPGGPGGPGSPDGTGYPADPTYGAPPAYPTYGPSTYGSPTYGSPTYGSPTYGPPAEDPKSTRRRAVILGGVIAVGLLAIAGGGIAIGASLGTGSSTNAGNTGTGSAPLPKSINVSAIAAKVDPSVVDITSSVSATAGGGRDAGTGMIISSTGEVLTNNHVVYEATSITAQIDGKGTVYTAKVLGVDPTQDVALIQLEKASGLPAVSLGDSSNVKIGDDVVAIGNALALTGPPTVTEGLVSALDRSITASDAGSSLVEHLHGLIQTDAPINPGNSGGPLVDSSGKVIGMITANASGSPEQSATNIGFAIPINRATVIAAQIQAGKPSKTVEIGEQGFIGVGVDSVSAAESNPVRIFGGMFGATYTSPVATGAVVTEVVAGTPAATNGIGVGDVITRFDGHKIGTPSALHDAVANLQPDSTTSISWVDLNGRHHTSVIKLAVKPFD
jgi:S1-C subfamily serine protease